MIRMVEKASPSEAGCWIDGHWGQYGSQRLIAIASCYGFKYGAIDFEDDSADMIEEIVYWSDKAEEWLNENVAPEGFSFGWHDGEFFLWSTESWEES